MKLFELSWSWHEEYCPFQFFHDNKTGADFEADCKMLFQKYGDEFIAQEESWVGAYDWTSYVASKLPELGYIPAEKEGQVNVWGAYIIKNEPYAKDDREFAEEFIGDELLAKAVEHNVKLEKVLDEDRKRILK